MPDAPTRRARLARVLALAGLAVFVLGVLATGGGALLIWRSAQSEQSLTVQWKKANDASGAGSAVVTAAAAATSAPPVASHAPATRPAHVVTQALFAIDIPRLHYFAAVQQGVSLGILFVGPGHYPTTPMPGGEGNVGIAAHNTYWIAFGQLKAGDSVILETSRGRFTYSVTGSQVVPASNRTVLAQAPGHHLTLTTCWPLWAGALATQRLAIFAVQA